MAKRLVRTFAACAALAALAAPADAANLRSALRAGTPELRSAGPLAFGPDGILFVADPKSAAVFAVDVGDAGRPREGKANVEGIDRKVADALGTSPDRLLIEDMAVSPATGAVYLSVSRGRGPDAQPVLLRVAGDGRIAEVPLEGVPFAEVRLSNAPADEGEGRRNQRRESITDLAYVDGRLVVAGLSNEEFASKLRSIPFPFAGGEAATSVEVFHGAHGKLETRSPVRTFVPMNIAGEPHLVAAYTCTPLVTFPVADLAPGAKVRGKTVAELGNRNRPLDMITYRRDGRDYLLMANSSRGLMRIPADGIDQVSSIEEKVAGTAGLKYDTVPGLDGVVQLDRLDDGHAVVVVQEGDHLDLRTIATP